MSVEGAGADHGNLGVKELDICHMLKQLEW